MTFAQVRSVTFPSIKTFLIIFVPVKSENSQRRQHKMKLSRKFSLLRNKKKGKGNATEYRSARVLRVGERTSLIYRVPQPFIRIHVTSRAEVSVCWNIVPVCLSCTHRNGIGFLSRRINLLPNQTVLSFVTGARNETITFWRQTTPCRRNLTFVI